MSSNQNCELALKALEKSIEKVVEYYEDTNEDSKGNHYFEDRSVLSMNLLKI
jgi:hypothetical protein